uniref:Uncharacterized protein n=1 Tax=Opuntia streptacantha TaxID=393608 RepID=A0A7C9CZI4_OPUST
MIKQSPSKPTKVPNKTQTGKSNKKCYSNKERNPLECPKKKKGGGGTYFCGSKNNLHRHTQESSVPFRSKSNLSTATLNTTYKNTAENLRIHLFDSTIHFTSKSST